jgi:predicted MPP superfamily phosphohydrolase
MRLGFAVFFVVLGSVLYLVNRHVLGWATRAFSLSPRARRAVSWVLGFALLGMLGGRLLSWVAASPLVTALVAVSSTFELAVLISFALLLPADLVRVGVWLRQRFSKPKTDVVSVVSGHSTESAAADLEQVPRRAFLTQAAAGSAFLIGGGSALYGALAGRQDYALEEVPIRLPGLSRALDGFSIVQLSDLHIGQFTGRSELAAAEALVLKARPDLIVLTGDLLDNDPKLAPELGAFVRRLAPLARHGVIAIPGNHDFFAGIDPVVRAVEGGGGTMLRNRGSVIGDASAGFTLLGVDDVWARRQGGGPNLERTLATLPRLGGKVAPALDHARVLLCHNPSYFAEAAGHVQLQLSGHTHGGQVNLLVRPADLLLPGGWVAGRYTRAGSDLYVNRGFGTVGPPARLGSPPEVTKIVLTV